MRPANAVSQSPSSISTVGSSDPLGAQLIIFSRWRSTIVLKAMAIWAERACVRDGVFAAVRKLNEMVDLEIRLACRGSQKWSGGTALLANPLSALENGRDHMGISIEYLRGDEPAAWLGWILREFPRSSRLLKKPAAPLV